MQSQQNDGKEITVTLEDALISLESLRFMMGGNIKKASEEDSVWVHHTAEVVLKAPDTGTVNDDTPGIMPLPVDHITGAEMKPTASAKHPIRVINLTKGVRTQITSGTLTGNDTITFNNTAAGINAYKGLIGDRLRISWDQEVKASELTDGVTETAVEVTISPSTFPGTYRVIGDTFMRSQADGRDEAFQFVIEKAKVLSDVTITLEAEGDPSTFEMQLSVLRDEDGNMMKLIRYAVPKTDETSGGGDIGSLNQGS